MRFSHFFIDRPRFAVVISILITIVGILAYFKLPISQYPEIAPPTITVNAVYPGATPEIIADTVATPIEQEVNGVEDMLYMTSQSTSDGGMTLTITFKVGTDLDIAQVLVQNRVAIAEPRLPEEVRRLGVVTQKSSPNLMMVVHLLSPDDTYDQLYISNYAFLNIRDVLSRIEGVGSLRIYGGSEYSMRIWLDSDRLKELGLTASDVVSSLQAQNVQVASGTLGEPPMPSQNAFQLAINTQGRFIEPEEFENVIVKTGKDGRLIRVRDIARVELGARDYVTNSYLNGKPAVAILVFQQPGSNALSTADEIQAKLADLSENFPDGLAYNIVYNPTEFVRQSVHAVYKTIFEATILVILVIVLFLQNWRAAIIPIVAIPVSLIGTFAIMQVVGFSLNNLSLFGLVLAIGIVVDDAIVVVENMERNIATGMSARDAARLSMNEVGSALIATSIVLIAVFIPTAFLGGISGQFFRQFAITISAATVISTLNSLTLSPALGALFLRSTEQESKNIWAKITDPFFHLFNKGFDKARSNYASSVCKVVSRPALSLIVYAVLILLAVIVIQRVPGGFIPQQDQGYIIVAAELPKGSSLERTDKVIQSATKIIQNIPSAYNVVAFSGFSGATFSNASNAGAIFVTLKPFEDRSKGETSSALVQRVFGALSQIQEAQLFVLEPPPVPGLGTGGGFKMMTQDRSGRGLRALEAATWQLVGASNQEPNVERVFSTFSTDTPKYFLDIDRAKAEMLNVPVENIFNTLQVYLGSSYVNDFNLFGRTYRVTAQADAPYRQEPVDIANLRTRSTTGAMVPLGSVLNIVNTSGPDRIVRHNLYPAAEIQGSAVIGTSSGDALKTMEKLAANILPQGINFEWTELAFQQQLAGNAGLLVFPLSVLFVFLLLAAQYESWSLPIAIILIVPLCILFALLGVLIRGQDNNILTQIGFVVLIALACKNAILMVEFAKQKEDEGENIYKAATEAAQLRLRPILMTAFSFILGVVPLVIASGAAAEMRQALGTTVFSGMLGITIAGLFLTPVFYVVVRKFVTRNKQSTQDPAEDIAL